MQVLTDGTNRAAVRYLEEAYIANEHKVCPQPFSPYTIALIDGIHNSNVSLVIGRIETTDLRQDVLPSYVILHQSMDSPIHDAGPIDIFQAARRVLSPIRR